MVFPIVGRSLKHRGGHTRWALRKRPLPHPPCNRLKGLRLALAFTLLLAPSGELTDMHIRFALLTAALGAAAAWGQITAVNGASYAPGQPVSPGSFATIFGQGLCAQTAAGSWIALGKLPLTLGGCSVEVAGVPAMLSFVSPTQINFIVPEDAGTGRAVLSVRNGSGVITGSVVIGRSGPGIFSLNGLGMGEGAVLHGKSWQRGPFSVTTDGQPTPVTIFVTGLDLATAPTVTIGGVPAEVLFYGNAPGFAGLQQINAMLPPSLAGAGRVPVVVTSGGSASNVTYITLLPTSQMMAGIDRKSVV